MVIIIIYNSLLFVYNRAIKKIQEKGIETMNHRNDIVYAGVNDHNIDLFEGQYVVPNGMAYNSYVILDEKTAVLDTVDIGFTEEWLNNIAAALNGRSPDYLIVQHMEPDHSASIGSFLERYPDVTVVGNPRTFIMLYNYFPALSGQIKTLEVNECDLLSLGKHELQFVLTPMVHWPETMVTLDTTTHTLFSGDAFGCFGALNGGVVDSDINCDSFWMEMIRYYSNIVGKYGIPVQNALKKLAGVQIDYICSTHGPVWHDFAARVIGTYDRLSRYEAEPGLVICYGTMYGNTERMAEIIAQAASRAGVKDIVIYNVSKTHHSFILRDIFRYSGLIVGAPTYNAGLYHEMEVLLSEISNRDIKNRLFGWFGSHGWASRAVAKIGEWNETHLKFEAVGEPVDMKQALTPEVRKQCEALGVAMAERLLEGRR